MSARPTANRSINQDEIAVIRTALEQAAVAPEYRTLADGLGELRVVSRCPCGCDTVEFARVDPRIQPIQLADAVGSTLAGGTVGLIVWGTPDAVTGVEVYDLGAGDGDLRLPVPASIVPWERGGERLRS